MCSENARNIYLLFFVHLLVEMLIENFLYVRDLARVSSTYRLVKRTTSLCSRNKEVVL